MLFTLSAAQKSQNRVQDPESILLIPNSLSQEYTLKPQEYKYFYLNVFDYNAFDYSQDLIVKVQPTDLSGGDPDVFISKTNRQPTGYESSDWVCSTSGKDTCSINQRNISDTDQFFIGVRCYFGCKMTIFPQFVREIELNDGEEVQYDFNPLEGKIFKFFVPSNYKRDPSQVISSVTITAVPTFVQSAQQILLAASVKPGESPSSSSIRGVPGWRNGQVMRLSIDRSDEFCNNCWILILVDVTQAGYYKIMAKTNQAIPQIYRDKRIDDIGNFGVKSCYKYYVQEESSELQVRVAQYSGLISYTINPRTIPDSSNKAAFEHSQFKSSIAKITPSEKKSFNAQTGLYYICIFPHVTATYSILVMERKAAQSGYEVLVDGFDQNGEVIGNGSITPYLYKVPDLDYNTEDINIEFMLTTISGQVPLMYTKFCDQQIDKISKCIQNLSPEYLQNPKNLFQKAEARGNDLDLIIDHDEQRCQNEFNGECYFVLAIVGQAKSDTDVTKYTIATMHNQMNFYILQEGQVVNDYLDGSYYRYYQFTVLGDERSCRAKNVTFKLNTYHGDADLFVSRKTNQPTKNENEKSSLKTSSILDWVNFDDESTCATYYVGVNSFGYSTYGLVALVDRGQGFTSSVQQLIEGVPVKSSIHNEETFDTFEMQVKQVTGSEKNLKIQVTQLTNKVKFYVHTSNDVSSSNFIWSSTGNALIINKKDKQFKRDSTYYIAVYPEYAAWRKITDDWYIYTIVYTQEDSNFYLQSQTSLSNSQAANTKTYFKHFIKENTKDISLSMSIISGNPHIYASLISSEPDEQNFLVSTKDQTSSLQGKTLLISNQNILYSGIQSCLDLTPTSRDEQPCTLNVGVFCSSECSYTINLQYESYEPQLAYLSIPLHGLAREGAMKYYYVILSEDKGRDVYAVLTSEIGNVDLFVKYQSNPHIFYPDEWEMPTQSQYEQKSDQLLGQDKIYVKSDEIQECFNDFITDSQYTVRQCALVFGVYAPREKVNLSQEQAVNVLRKYSLLIYADVQMLQSNQPISGVVKENQFQYYIFEAKCKNCSLVIQCISMSINSNPDLYISYKDERLPTTTDYDIQSTSSKSEILILGLDDDFFQYRNIKSMQATYIVGVFGVVDSTYQLTVTQEEFPMTRLVEGYSVKNSQPSYEIAYFYLQNFRQEKDFLIHIDPRIGSVDLFVSTFDEADETQTLTSRLPSSKKKALWILENIQPTTDNMLKELLILNTDSRYCEKCSFLLGVVTHEKNSDYLLYMHSLEASYENALLVRLGEVYQVSLEEGKQKMFRFMLDQRGRFSLQQTLNTGDIDSQVSLTPLFDQKQVISQLHNTEILFLEENDDKLVPGKMNYYTIKANKNSSFSFMLMQDRTIIHLSDGVPVKLIYKDSLDLGKNMIFNLPEGQFTVNIQVKSLGDKFYPRLYIRYYEDLDQELNGLEFPPNGVPDYFICKKWDYKYSIMNYQETFSNVQGTQAGLALNLYDVSYDRVNKPNQEVYLTITTSQITKMVTNQLYSGSLAQETSFMIYQVDESLLKQTGYALVEFSECIGQADISFINSSTDINQITNDITYLKFDQNGKTFYNVELPRDSLYFLVKPRTFQGENEDDQSTGADFLLKVSFNEHRFQKNINYQLEEEGKITILENNEQKTTFTMSWGEVSMQNLMKGKQVNSEVVNYVVAVTKDKRTRLDSICTLKKEVSQKYVVAFFDTNQTEYEFKNRILGQRYYINVMAMVKMLSHQLNQVKVEGQDEMEVIPYKPIEVYSPIRSNISWLAIVLYTGLAIVFFVVGGFYWRKGKEFQQKLELEMTDIRRMASVSDYAMATQQIREEREQRYQGLNNSEA